MERWFSKPVFVLIAMAFWITSTLTIPAEAVMITLEPDDYAIGTNVSHLFDGVTLQRYSADAVSPPTWSDVYIEALPDYLPAVTGTQIFGRFWDPEMVPLCMAGCSAFARSDTPFSALVVQFTNPTNFFEVAGSQFFEGLIAIGITTDNQFISPSYTIINHGDIRHAQFGAIDGTPFLQSVYIGGWLSNTYVDTMQYNAPVPEPATLWLLAAGLCVGLLIFSHRFRQV